MLREARLARGISLADAEEATKIRGRYLEALEKEAFDVLPGRVYVKGFLRNYARFLGLDGELMAASYDEQFPAVDARPVDISPVEALPAAGENKPAPVRRTAYRIAGAALVVALVGAAGWLSAGLPWTRGHVADQPPKSKPSPVAPANPGTSGRGWQTAPQDASGTSGANTQAKGVNLVLNVTRDSCWMQVVVDGKTQFTGELAANQSRAFKGQKNIWVKLGNAGAVNVQYNGRDLGALGGPYQVVTKNFPPANQG
ncbi:helix-turn-helix domain-containing protein [Desulfotomaculum copahuensis]|uniref:helix-turn-helix domain-containing protein n=1 Tax=Desulfotomaculum copahuensis TaxID=1838280 RepID=UPI003D06623D